MVDGREKTELYKAYDKVCAEFALPILETHLPDSKRFRKETAAERKAVFRSTGSSLVSLPVMWRKPSVRS